MRVCAAPGCPRLVRVGYCPEHQRVQDRARRDEPHRQLYRTSRWKHMSRQQLAAEPWCWYCLQRGVKTLATQTDHVLPASTHPEEFFNRLNHRSACAECNAAKGDRECRQQI